MDYETETLRFMDDDQVPFTNNLDENDIRKDKDSAKNIGLLSFGGRGCNFLQGPQLPVNMQKAWDESNRSVTSFIRRQAAGFYE